MKILLVLDCNTSFISGVTQSVIHLSKGLSDLGHDVRILMASPDGKTTIEDKAFLAPSIRFDLSYPGLRIACFLPGVLKKALIDWKPDIIHTNTESFLYLAVRKIVRKTGAKHIHSFHTNYLECYSRYIPVGKKLALLVMLAYGKLCFRQVDGMISPSERGRSLMERFHFTAPYYILSNGIRTDLFGADHSASREEIRLQYGIQEKETLLLFVGRIAAEKNLPKLLEYFEHVRNARVKLMIVGDGPVLKDLKKHAETLKAKDRIIFTGMVSPGKIYDYYSTADIFVTTSLAEVQPLTYIEAMASGLPVVCSCAPFIDGLVIDGETGFSIQDAAGFAKRIELLSSDPELRRTIGDNAKLRIQDEFSVESFARNCERIYSEFL